MKHQYKSILVGIDGSQEAEYAFQKSIRIAKRNKDSKLTIVNVINTSGFESSALRRTQKLSEDLVKDYESQAEAEGIEGVSSVIEFGSPKTLITNEIAESVKADLIVCGATGLNVVERFITGSVSGAIVRSATCDVLVVRKPE
ncbi:universal stress protein [Oceanobacillus rekensis]|uniref:universal stress protein n=1 Tax=Oceanobacillus rekensis TaxID=937927 RepID=UPI000B444A92|nr:universal stress protein [Oceanobacillus rekensis]